MRSFVTTSLACVSVCALGGCDAELDPTSGETALEESVLVIATVDDDAGRGAKLDPGTRRHRFEVDGIAREVIVHFPRSAERGRPVPVVFMLHGTSGDGERFLRMSGWREKATEEGFIAVFPSALTYCFFEDENRDGDFDDRGELKVTTKWAAGKLGDPAAMPLCSAREIERLRPERRALVDHPLMDDVAYFDRMLELLAARYPVDRDRIYASGFSNGGAMTSRLALERYDRFAALSASGGTMNLDPVTVPRPLSFAFTLGAEDDRFTEHYGVDAFDVSADFFETQVGMAVGHRIARDYLTLCGLSEDYTYEERLAGDFVVGDFVFATPVAGDGGNVFHFALIEGLAHAYANGRNHPLRLADPLWRFFAKHSLR